VPAQVALSPRLRRGEHPRDTHPRSDGQLLHWLRRNRQQAPGGRIDLDGDLVSVAPRHPGDEPIDRRVQPGARPQRAGVDGVQPGAAGE
jgi:hypothetical protein